MLHWNYSSYIQILEHKKFEKKKTKFFFLTKTGFKFVVWDTKLYEMQNFQNTQSVLIYKVST